MITSPFYVATACMVVISYFVCGIPFGKIIARQRGHVDVTKTGSGNIGTTNVVRSAGVSSGVLTLACDAGKGLLCTAIARLVIGGLGFGGDIALVEPTGEWGFLLALVYLACIGGHVFSPYLGFHGGKGIAVGFGAALGFMWPVALGLLVVFMVFAVPTRYVSAGSIAAAVSLPFLSVLFYGFQAPFFVFLAVVSCIVVWAHRSNVLKLARGEENKFTFHPKTAAQAKADDEEIDDVEGDDGDDA